MTKLLLAASIITLCLSAKGEFCNDTTPAKRKIIIQILDENNNVTAAKIRVTEKDTIYYAPDAHAADFVINEKGGDVMLDNNRRFAYVDGYFSYQLPEASLRFEVIKGYAYTFYDTTIQITAK